MLKEVISEEQALKEIDALLDKKKILPKRRATIQEGIDTVVEAMMYGLVTIDEKGCIKQTLQFPLGDNNSMTELVYADRIAPATIQKALSTIKVDSGTNRCLAYITTYTSNLQTTILNLESPDWNIAAAISLFFM